MNGYSKISPDISDDVEIDSLERALKQLEVFKPINWKNRRRLRATFKWAIRKVLHEIRLRNIRSRYNEIVANQQRLDGELVRIIEQAASMSNDHNQSFIKSILKCQTASMNTENAKYSDNSKLDDVNINDVQLTLPDINDSNDVEIFQVTELRPPTKNVELNPDFKFSFREYSNIPYTKVADIAQSYNTETSTDKTMTTLEMPSYLRGRKVPKINVYRPYRNIITLERVDNATRQLVHDAIKRFSSS